MKFQKETKSSVSPPTQRASVVSKKSHSPERQDSVYSLKQQQKRRERWMGHEQVTVQTQMKYPQLPINYSQRNRSVGVQHGQNDNPQL